MKLLLLVLYFFSSLTPSFSFYDNQALKLNKRSFERSILPQLKSINRDFYSMLKNFDQRYSVLLEGRTVILSLSSTSSLKELSERLLNLESILNRLDVLGVASLSTRHDLWILEISNFHKKVIDFSNQVQRALFEGASKEKKWDHFSHTISRLKIIYQRFFLVPLEDNLRRIVTELYHSFILPTEQHILKKKSKQYLLKNLETLNFAWNNFHMRISKGPHKQPTKILIIGKTMHQRWSNILRIIIRP